MKKRNYSIIWSLKIFTERDTCMTRGEGGPVLYLHSGAITSPRYVVTHGRRVPLLRHENRELILYLCVTPAARINTSAPLATRGGIPLMRGSSEGGEPGFYGLLIFTGSSRTYRDVRAD